MTKLHKLLQRQVSRLLGDAKGALSEEQRRQLGPFLEAISRAYSDFDSDRRLLESSMEISSKELYEANLDMRAKNEELKVLNEVAAGQQATLASSAKMSELGKMAGGIAHEINSPLAAITLYANLITEECTSGEANLTSLAHFASIIEQTSERIAKIISGLRTFSRDGSHDPFLPTEVSNLVSETMMFCSQRFAQSSVQLTVSVPPGLLIKCRSTQISQVLLNILNNAFDAISELGEKWIRITAQDCGPDIEIQITDSGDGISPEIQEKLFTPFFTTKAIGKGTGLGLSISMGIMTSHQGKISIDSTCTNTRFIIRLPKDPITAQDKSDAA